MKAVELTRCLEGTALELIQSLSQEERLDYEAIKLALQQRFRCTEGYYRKQFKMTRTRHGESQKSLVDRITLYLRRWVEMSGLEMTVEGLTEVIVKDSYFLSQSREIQVFLKEAGNQNLIEMTKRCQNYREAHNIHGDEQVSFDKKKHNQGAVMESHLLIKGNSHQSETSSKLINTKTDSYRDRQSGRQGAQYKPTYGGCFVCDSLEHKAFACPQRFQQSIP